MNDKILKTKVSFIEDKFWYEDVGILFNTQRLDEFFPNKTMNLAEQLNALLRLTIYIGLVLFLYNRNIKYLYIPILTGLFTYVIWYYSKKNKEKFENIEEINDSIYARKDKNVVLPSKNNPFMNVLMSDYLENPNRIAASSLNNYNNDELNKLIDNGFYYNLYRNLGDVFNKENSQRQFYTMPDGGQIPNDQGSLANWLYRNGPSCKEGNGTQCFNNNFDWLKDSKSRNPFMI